MDFEIARERLQAEFGEPARQTAKVVAWDKNGIGIVLQIDQPNRDPAAYIWLPYPEEGGSVPEIALEYAAEFRTAQRDLCISRAGEGEARVEADRAYSARA